MVEVQIGGEAQYLSTLEAIKQYLGVEGLVKALLDLTRKKKLFKRLLGEVHNCSVVSPFMTLKIQQPFFQFATGLKDHIIHCITGENYWNREPRADFVLYQPPKDS